MLHRRQVDVARRLAARALDLEPWVPGHLRIREDLVQPAESQDRTPHQVRQGRRRHRRGGRERGHIVKGYKVDTDTFVEVAKEELENVALESTRTIEIDEFVDRAEIDPRYLIRPYYLRPDGKVGHVAFAVIRETIREMNKVAIGRVVLTNREHIIALEPLDKGLMGTLLRYPYEVRSEDEYFERDPGRQSHQGHARSRQAHRQPEVRTVRAQEVRGPVRDRLDRAHQPEAVRQADRAEGAAARRERCRPDGGAAQERRRRRYFGEQGVEKADQEAAQGCSRSEGNADADRRQEAERDGGEEAGGQIAAEVGIVLDQSS
jgi:hypothetical protein